jgi:hypothetical protein
MHEKNCPISLWTDFPHFGSKTTFWVLHLTFKIRTNVLSKKNGFKKIIMAPCRTTVPCAIYAQFICSNSNVYVYIAMHMSI